MLKTLTRIRSLLQRCKVNEARAVARHISSHNPPRDVHLVQPGPGICSMVSLSMRSRPSLLMTNNARLVLPRKAGIGLHYPWINTSSDLRYPWINAPGAHNTEIIGDLRYPWINAPGAHNTEIIGDLHYPWINISDAHTTEIIGDDALNGDIIGYDTFEKDSGKMNCSSILKKRKHKMNKHKYKKRRKRDKFKRRNLENIKERKQKARDKADERAKQATG